MGSVKKIQHDENVEKNYFGIKNGKRKINVSFFFCLSFSSIPVIDQTFFS